MSTTQPDQQFWELTDTFIREANEQCSVAERAKVGAALLYAAARFNAFVAAAAAGNESSFQADRPKAFEYFSDQYARMLAENLNEWANNFARNLKQSSDPGS